MNLCDVPTLKSLLERHVLKPTKLFGQHFLISTNVVEAIVSRVDAFGAKSVFEVGPGPGVLTTRLAERLPVSAVEIDPVAVSALTESAPSAKVIQADALQVNLGEHCRELPSPRAVVSNMPYNITGPLLTAFTRFRSDYAVAILMMQKEVGEKILAEPGDREIGSISVFLKSRFDVEIVCKAPAGAFFPPPKVDSLVLQFVPKPAMPEKLDASHETLVRQAFSQPRKTLANNLKALNLPQSLFSDWLEAHEYHNAIRPHEVSLDAWMKLAQDWDATRRT